jgi:chemotaxis-related protein WspB
VLFLLFQLGRHRFALEASRIQEVLPLVDIMPVPQGPAGLAGVFDFRGTPVPVIDASHVMLGRPAERRLSTRVIVVRDATAGPEARLVGLLAERVTETVRREPGEFVDSGITREQAPYLGPVAIEDRGLVQRIDLDALLALQLVATGF